MKAILVSILLLINISVFAQNSKRILLSDYINTLKTEYKVSFSFDPNFIENIKVFVKKTSDLKKHIAHLDSTTAFTFSFADNENILISPKKNNFNILIKGKVREKSGAPLNGALIYIKNQSLGITSNENGDFDFNASYNPNDTLTISYTGFKSKKILLSQINENGNLDLELQEGIILLAGTTINAYLSSGINYSKDNQSIIISPANTGLIPGETESDIYNTLQALPGINCPDDKAGNLTMRGSDPDKVLITFDNIPIYHIGHYFGTFSPFNVQVIDEITIQRNGILDNDKGGRVGGMINIKTVDKILDSAQYSAGLASSYFLANAFVPIVKNKLGFYVSGRSSYPFKWNSPRINSINNFIFQESHVGGALLHSEDFVLNEFDYGFSDINAKLIYQPHKNHKLSLSYLRISDKLNVDEYSYIQESTLVDSVKLNNWGLNLSIIDNWTEKITTTTNVTKSYYYQRFAGIDSDSGTVIGGESFTNSTDNFKINSNTKFILNNDQFVSFGLEIDQVNLLSEATVLIPPNPEGISIVQDKEYIHSAFAGFNHFNSTKFFNFFASIRGSYFTGTSNFYIEPRAGINLIASKNLTFKASAGIYNQFINQLMGTHTSTIGGVGNLNWRLSNDNTIPVVTSKQAMTGFIYSKNGWVIDVEGYYKITENCTSYNFVNNNASVPYIYGGYDNSGFDILLKKSFKTFESWVSYSYSSSNAKFDTLKFEYIWNQPHLFSAVAAYRWKNFKFSIGWKYKSGLSALDGRRTRILAGKVYIPGYVNQPPPPPGPPVPRTIINPEAEYKDRYPDNHQMDISVSYKFVPKNNKWILNIGASIQNVYNNQVLFVQSLRPVPNAGPNTYHFINKYGLGFTPSFQVSISW